MKIKSVRQLKNVRGKRVIVRCDFNVDIRAGKVLDDYKIIRSLPTLRLLAARGARVIIVTHLGRPAGKRQRQYSVQPLARRLRALLGKQIAFCDECVGEKAEYAVGKLRQGGFLLLENVRFYPGEEKNDRAFARALARLGDIYVNDALAVSHRAHASVAAVAALLPAYGGLLLEEEVRHLSNVLHPQRPLVVIMGGAKIETKAPVIRRLRRKAQFVLIGGMLAYPLLAAHKKSTGRYRVSDTERRAARRIARRNVIMPRDFLISTSPKGTGALRVVTADKLPATAYQVDVGPETIRAYASIIKRAKTIVWNGPLGLFEQPRCSQGTRAIARLVASRGAGKAFAVVGGGQTETALRDVAMADYVDWVSTSGGAMLAFLAGEKLPGLRPITRYF